jgi:cell division protein FtsW (lipid II flippase)
MSGYNNDYNKDLYTAQSSDFCKSCYSSTKGRGGCLVAILLAALAFLLYRVVASVTASQTAAVIAVGLVVALIIFRTIKKRKSNKD